MLGGCSSINAMVYARGNSRDYDGWESMGNPTWNWNNVFEYFKKSEDMRIPEVQNSPNFDKYHKIGGPLAIDSFYEKSFIHNLYENATIELGYKVLDDMNEEFVGLSKIQGNFDHNVRSSTAHAFLSQARNRVNLHVIKNAYVTKILFDNKNQANMVEFQLKNKLYTVRQRKEIILSAGAIGTPQILMQSGVGPEEHLKDLNIPLIANLPVGQNLQDHVCTTIFFRLNKSTATTSTSDNPSKTNGNILTDYVNYLLNKSGSMTKSPIFHLAGFFNTIDKNAKFPDTQIVAVYFEAGQDKEFKKVLEDFGYGDKLMEAEIANRESDVILFSIVLLNPLSLGEIRLKENANPFDMPYIHANYLKNSKDADTLVKGIQFLRQFLQTNAFKKYDIQDVPITTFSECDEPYGSDEFWKCYVRYITTSLYHPVGTAKMGPENDVNSVVDSELRVRKVKGLRVIDASIMPTIVSANTNAPTIMIAEKGSDMIKNKYGNVVHDEM